MKNAQLFPIGRLSDQIEQSRTFDNLPKLQVYSDAQSTEELDGEVWPTFSSFLVLCAVSLFALSVGVTFVVLNWFPHFPLLVALAVYFAVVNAVLLTAAVVVALLSVESYDLD